MELTGGHADSQPESWLDPSVFLVYSSFMAARSVQISLDEDLLSEIDRRKETKEHGRSALIRKALRMYLSLERQRSVDGAYDRIYGGRTDEVWADFAELMDGQQWPER